MDGLMRVESAIYHWRSGEYVQAQGFQPVFYGLPEAGVQPVVGHAVCERGAGQIEQRPCRGFRRRDQRQQGHAQGLQRQALRHQPPVGLLQGGQSFFHLHRGIPFLLCWWSHLRPGQSLARAQFYRG